MIDRLLDLSVLAARKQTDYDLAGGLAFLAVVAVIFIPIWLISSASKAKAEAKRREDLYRKYGRTLVAENIIAQKIWVGETTGQLRDSLGPPADIDQKVLKTKTKEIWKYAHRGGNRYGLRITVENGAVVGWDEKM